MSRSPRPLSSSYLAVVGALSISPIVRNRRKPLAGGSSSNRKPAERGSISSRLLLAARNNKPVLNWGNDGAAWTK